MSSEPGALLRRTEADSIVADLSEAESQFHAAEVRLQMAELRLRRLTRLIGIASIAALGFATVAVLMLNGFSSQPPKPQPAAVVALRAVGIGSGFAAALVGALLTVVASSTKR